MFNPSIMKAVSKCGKYNDVMKDMKMRNIFQEEEKNE